MSDGLTCITVGMIPTDMTIEDILDCVNETGRDMHKTQQVSSYLLVHSAM